ncbi:hypothetical protein M0D21_08245 [Aquimarina sp. D1M17]|uniref:hypothetical protein n=1 Tax=Aquimarina acroporae TaxID=2937283 RepID=UPI0020BDF164|nr:hypothetical protein [Aquimarina acroporae]MCK8521555.1 hypothetical protein [Aquimarina acroporae]
MIILSLDRILYKTKRWKKIQYNLNQFGEAGGNPLENGFILHGYYMKPPFAFMSMAYTHTNTF